MIIPFLKVWLWGTMVVWSVLMWRWKWTQKVLGVIKLPVDNPDRKWYELPKEEWVEREASIWDALYFSFAWPLLLFSLIAGLMTYIGMGLVELLAQLVNRR